jgi:3-hydroxyisobutyrate dehydrogenase-like beta-hydroxyacid dehydrogenase
MHTQDEAPPDAIGVIGLGLLGTALAERLLAGGYRIVVTNRTREKADPLIARGAIWSDNPLRECQRNVVCLYTSEIVSQMLEQLSEGLRPGHVIIDTTTGDPEQSAAMGAKLAEKGVRYLETPIAASSEQTRRGEAVAIAAGPEETYEACRDLLICMAPKTYYVGVWGNAARVKLVNNLVLGLNRIALAEGLLFARAIGLDAGETLAVLQQGNAYSVAMDVKGRKMVEEDFSTQAKLSQHIKDVRLILDEAASAGLALPASQLHLQLLERAETAGWGELDNSVIIKAIEAVSLDSLVL